MANKFTDAVFKAKLTGTLKLVLYAIAHRSDNKTGRCWPSYQRIADDCGIGRQTAVDAVSDALSIGVIRITGLHDNEHGQPSNEYALCLEKLVELATSDKHAFKSKPRKNHNGSRAGTGDELVRLPGPTITGAVIQPVREPGRTITGDDHELSNELSTENSSGNSSPLSGRNINTENPHARDSNSYSAEAENLSELFVGLLKSNPNVKFIPSNWQQTHPVVIQQLIEDYGDSSAIEKIIRFSQTTKWAKYIVRLETLVSKAQDIWNQILTIEFKRQQREEEQPLPTEGEEERFVTVPAVEDDEDFG